MIIISSGIINIIIRKGKQILKMIIVMSHGTFISQRTNAFRIKAMRVVIIFRDIIIIKMMMMMNTVNVI